MKGTKLRCKCLKYENRDTKKKNLNLQSFNTRKTESGWRVPGSSIN